MSDETIAILADFILDGKGATSPEAGQVHIFTTADASR